jgi:polysaccharide export outer membrane protein
VAPAWAQQQKLETPQETNAKIRQLAATSQASLSDYVIGTGDLLRVEVFDVPDVTREVRVSESGYISLPLIPVRIRAAGLTSFQLEEKVAELLQVNGLVSHPRVTVYVKEQRSQPITVIGAVKRPMIYQALRQTTLLEVLSEAGGIADDAGSTVLVTRSAGPRTSGGEDANEPPTQPQAIVISLKDLLESGDPKFNILVFGGDVVSVPRAGIIYVVGAVERPGGFVLQSEDEEMTALKAVALAQGLKGSAKPGQAVIIRKDPATGKKQEIDVNLSKIMARKHEDTPLFANDILFIPDSAGKRVLRRVGDVALGITSGLIIIRGGH